jgi:hypothetical protein
MKKSVTKRQKKIKQKVFKDNRKEKETAKEASICSCKNLMTKSNTARTDDRSSETANKVYSESNPYRTGVGDSLREIKKRNDRRKLERKNKSQ